VQVCCRCKDRRRDVPLYWHLTALGQAADRYGCNSMMHVHNRWLCWYDGLECAEQIGGMQSVARCGTSQSSKWDLGEPRSVLIGDAGICLGMRMRKI
jgi:hypothetical protein